MQHYDVVSNGTGRQAKSNAKEELLEERVLVYFLHA